VAPSASQQFRVGEGIADLLTIASIPEYYMSEPDTPQGRLSQEKARPIDNRPLKGAARRAFENKILGRPEVKKSSQFLVRILLDDFCWGHADCFPANKTAGDAAGYKSRNVQLVFAHLDTTVNLLRLVVDRSIRSQRRIVFVDHPNAPDVFRALGQSPEIVALNPDIARKRAPRGARNDTPRGAKNGAPRGATECARNVALEAQHLESPTTSTCNLSDITRAHEGAPGVGEEFSTPGRARAKSQPVRGARRRNSETQSPPSEPTLAATPQHSGSPASVVAPAATRGDSPVARDERIASDLLGTPLETVAAHESDPRPESGPRAESRPQAALPRRGARLIRLTIPGSAPRDIRDQRQCDEDAAGITCATCRAAAIGLVLHDDDERSAISTLVGVDTGPSLAKSYVFQPSFQARIADLVTDGVLGVPKNGRIVVNPPDKWAPARLRAESAKQIAAIQASAPNGELRQCSPSWDHQAVRRGVAD
jgi:hypothetical protein